MKKSLITLAAIAFAASVFGQGQVQLLNRQTTDVGGGTVYSPIFGPEPGNPTLRKSGGIPTGNPSGNQVYNGAPLSGTGFTAALWFAAGTGQPESALQPATGVNTFRTGTSAGFLTTGPVATLPGVTGGRVTLQLRVWDNMGGTVTSWDQALARQDVAKGFSDLFSPTLAVGVPPGTPPVLQNMPSFNLTIVPEPSTIALSILGGLGTLLLIRRRK